jgi:CRP/FNR family transcriptional regulator, cyclic AMP receptor protein
LQKRINDTFDAEASPAKVGVGKTILKFQKGEHVFEQGAAADCVYYLQKGKIKLTVLSNQGSRGACECVARPPAIGAHR